MVSVENGVIDLKLLEVEDIIDIKIFFGKLKNFFNLMFFYMQDIKN